MISLAIRSLRARRGRTGLSIIGIALGIAVLYASLATDAGISASIDRTVRDLVGRADLRVEAFGPTGLAPASLAAIEDAPGVALAAPALERRTYLFPSLTDPSPSDPVTALGIDPAKESAVRLSSSNRAPPSADPTRSRRSSARRWRRRSARPSVVP